MIRKAVLKDLDQIWALRLKTTELLKSRAIDQWQYVNPSKERFIKDINDQSFFVYEHDDKIIGMIYLMQDVEETYLDILGKWRYDLPYITIHRLAVDKDYLNQGVSDALMRFAIDYTKFQKMKYLRIDTHADNRQAKRLFEKHGFVECGIILLDKDHEGDRKRLAFDLYLGV